MLAIGGNSLVLQPFTVFLKASLPVLLMTLCLSNEHRENVMFLCGPKTINFIGDLNPTRYTESPSISIQILKKYLENLRLLHNSVLVQYFDELLIATKTKEDSWTKEQTCNECLPGQMEKNLSTEFIIVGFEGNGQLRVALFVILLLIYLLTLLGNFVIMTIVYCSTNLHLPMYFFLTNLSFLDLTYTTIIFPKLLAHFFLRSTQISFFKCLLQMYFFFSMLSIELILLTVMAYDRYVAICNPLRYSTIMSKTACIQLAIGTWMTGFLVPLPHTKLVSELSFCASRTINHFFCDMTALIKLSCTSTHTIEALTYLVGVVVAMVPFLFIVISYINIISAVLKIRSTKGRCKAFSTCGSHLTVVVLFCGSLFSTYMRPTSTYSMNSNKLLSLSYVAVAPLCNPIIYSMKNKEFTNAIRKLKSTA
ncbi:olfactory receptor 5G9-like [Lissotriton helveticus]